MKAQGTLLHDYSFDPSHGYDEAALLQIKPDSEPKDFVPFWQQKRAEALNCGINIDLKDSGHDHLGWRVLQISYVSTEQAVIHGWLLLPKQGEIKRGFVIGHGYGGRDGPDFHLPFKQAALLFPVLRGMAQSPYPQVSAEPRWHVLHNIQDRQQYIFGGCVADTWLAVSTLLRLFPHLAGHLGYLGISFGGGIGALALAFEERISRAHINVPSFGHQRLRLQLDSIGSADSVQQFARRHPQVINNLDYFDAAMAARHITIPVHCALAGFDPFVAPAGQYAIYNTLAGPKQRFKLTAGHHPYPGQEQQNIELGQSLQEFFADL